MYLNRELTRGNAYLRTILFLLILPCVASRAGAQEAIPPPAAINNVVIELFYRSDSPQSLDAEKYLRQLQQTRPGIEVKSYDVLKDQQQLKRLWEISKRFGRKAGVPTIYTCDRLIVGFRDAQTTGAQVESLLTIKAYVRSGCKHCQAAKAFMDNMILRWPAIQVQYFDVVSDIYARAAAQDLAAKYSVQLASFPCIQVADRLVVGYQTDEVTGKRIEDLFQDRSVTFPPPAASEKERADQEPNANDQETQQPQSGKTETDKTQAATDQATGQRFANADSLTNGIAIRHAPALWLVSFLQVQDADRPPIPPPNGLQDPDTQSPDKVRLPDEVQLPGEVQLPDEVQLPGEVQLPDDVALPGEVQVPIVSGNDNVIYGSGSVDAESDEVEVPFFGRLSVSKIGLPAFTFLIGLVDGFNPCAMWVLVFLLSVLVNLKERKKILLVAGTFVVVSGLAYFVFMAAWFNVLQLIGLLRPVQIGLGAVAIVVGLINVKDYFAFHKGVTLSIPESAKPGIYRRVRSIVAAKNLYAALLAAVVLAIVVNIVELLCTAGLPALYTGVLTMQNLPTWVNYAYLGLYIVAYMLDDTILVAVVVTTLSHRRLQESEGRWLKLFSGVVILLLGCVMIFWPELLV